MKLRFFAVIPVVLLALTLPVISLAAAETSSHGDQPAAHQQVEDGHGKEQHGEDSHGHGHAPHIDGTHMNLLWVIPFLGILLSIAIFPLVAPHFWHHHYGKISLFWGVIFVVAFTLGYGLNVSAFYVVEVYLLEYIPFITLLLALFTVAGGIRLKGDLIGTPAVNGLIIFIGTILASWMGTTGAAMLLIRPLLRANAWRKYRVHTVVFFIFLVANIGGSLTPLGDPPLFLGFLKGVDFFWTTTHMFVPMVVVVVILMALFFAVDIYYYRKEPEKPVKDPEGTTLAIEGGQNLILVPAVVLAVLSSSLELGNAFTLHYVTVPTSKLLQVLLLLAITVISLIITKRETREGNEFTWEPILEVAKLFATIFITMVPPIAMLRAGSAGPMGAVIDQVITPQGEYINSAFFWATGVLSSFLDNAPTYVVFFNTAGGNAMELMTTHAETLLAISAGAVFMGANTYIGNAPNFMVKSIAEEAGVNMPSFFGYIIKYTIPILIPVFVIVTLIFFL
jgi:Na+/H+ antiporter NhaD/arsenite permease-like protein